MNAGRIAAAALLLLAGCGSPDDNLPQGPPVPPLAAAPPQEIDPMQRTDEEWRKVLTPEQYRVLRQKGTERAFTGEYDRKFDAGSYRCAGCGTVLFESDAKFDSGCGWPAFSAPKDAKAVAEHEDRTLGMVRTEVLCAKCGGHLGHVFDDGPGPTRMRYCINSASLQFEKKGDAAKDAPKK